MMASLASSKPGKLFLNQAAHTMMEMTKSPNARAEMIFVKNHTSRWTVVSLNFVSPDIATMRPMTVLSPIAKTMPVQVPWTTNVEVRARLRVSRALSDVASIEPGIMSLSERQHCTTVVVRKTYLSPVRSERSKRTSLETSTSLTSAGTRSPMRKETKSPTTTSVALILWPFPSRITVASSAIRDLIDFMIRDACQSTKA